MKNNFGPPKLVMVMKHDSRIFSNATLFKKFENKFGNTVVYNSLLFLELQ